MEEMVFALAGSVAGTETEAQELLERLCEAAIAMWKGRLAEGVTAEDCGTTFVCAAAFTAAADFCVARQGSSVASFAAGEISVKTRAGAETAAMAEELRQAAERMMAPYTGCSGGFAFLGVKG